MIWIKAVGRYFLQNLLLHAGRAPQTAGFMIEGRIEPSDRLLIAEGLGKTYFKGGKK
jgi:hypothetical protein